MCARATVRQDDSAKAKPEVLLLDHYLLCTHSVAEAAEWRRAARTDDIGAAPLGGQLLGALLSDRQSINISWSSMANCAEQIVEQHVAVAPVGFVIARDGIGQDQLAREPRALMPPRSVGHGSIAVRL